MILRIQDEAAVEIEAARVYLNQQSMGLGSRFIDELTDKIDAILAMPLAMPLAFPVFRLSHGYRRALLSTFRYAVFFEINADEIRIIAVAHTSRVPDYWFGRDSGQS